MLPPAPTSIPTTGRHLGVRLDPELEASLQLVAAQTGSSGGAWGCCGAGRSLAQRPSGWWRPQVRELVGLLQGEELAQ